MNIDEEVVAYARKRFDECLVAEPIEQLTMKNWLDRCIFPLGMDGNGTLSL